MGNLERKGGISKKWKNDVLDGFEHPEPIGFGGGRDFSDDRFGNFCVYFLFFPLLFSYKPPRTYLDPSLKVKFPIQISSATSILFWVFIKSFNYVVNFIKMKSFACLSLIGKFDAFFLSNVALTMK
ncbi:hypothetical protein L3X38_011698 [Prunus dulcis]|uniref:Uncharacterized protein n=1 Tax=Prunus dulcis TaxID=3755 RepID=A0AAD4ZEJ8_PRUDU|nr:hypothetical protein L3X38_011698 [Prunus dulcis]